MLEFIKSNLVYAIYVAFAFFYIWNIILGFFQNVAIKKEDFDLKLLLVSVIKIVLVGVFVFGVNFIFNLISNIDLVSNTLSIATFALIFGNAFAQYADESISKLKTMFAINNATITDIKDKPSGE